MSQLPDVSVVISTYNRGPLLAPAVRALLDEQAPGGATYEVIVVDNNSTDGTAEVLSGLEAGSGGRLRCLFEPRQGVSHGRNAGIAAARAPIIAFTDDDIRVAPDWVATLTRLFGQHPDVECVGGPVLPIWEVPPPRWLDARHWSPTAVTDYGPASFEISAARPRCLLTSNLAFRRRVFDRIGGFSPDFPRGQDHELQLRFWLAGGRAIYSPHLVVHTEVPAARMTKRYHRRWHTLNGRVCARMHLKERTAPDGSLRSAEAVGRPVFGVPGFLFRAVTNAAWRWAAGLARGNPSAAFARELAIRHFVGYILERRAEARSGSPGSRLPLLRRAMRWVDRRLARRRSRASLLLPDGALPRTRGDARPGPR